MQITEPVLSDTGNYSVVTAAAPTRAQTLFAKVRAFTRWTFDIDDGAGAIVCFACVLAVFGTLVFRLAQLDASLDSQALKCTAVNKQTLEMNCEFQ